MNVTHGSSGSSKIQAEADLHALMARYRADSDLETAERIATDVAMIQRSYTGIRQALAYSRYLTEFVANGQAILANDERFSYVPRFGVERTGAPSTGQSSSSSEVYLSALVAQYRVSDRETAERIASDVAAIAAQYQGLEREFRFADYCTKFVQTGQLDAALDNRFCYTAQPVQA